MGARQLQRNILQIAKTDLQQNINTLLTAIESDLIFCQNQQNSGQNSLTACNPKLIIPMLKNRIFAGTPIPADLGKLSGLFEYGHGDQPIVNEFQKKPTSTQHSPGNVGLESKLTPADFRAIINSGEKFIDFPRETTSDELDHGNLIFAKFFQPLNWIITAELYLDKVDAEIAIQSERLRQQLYIQTLKSTIPAFLFLLLASVIGYIFFARAAKAVDLQDEIVAESEGEVKNLQSKLTRTERAKNTAVAKEDLLEEILTAADNVVIFVLVEENNILHIQDVSSGAESLLGYQRHELVGQATSVLCREGNEELMRIHQEMLLTEANIAGDLELTKKNGKALQTKSSVYLHHDHISGATGMIVVAVDITKLEETRQILDDTQASLVEAHKMEAIGTLAGGIAHDFNNVLSSIVGYAELLKDQLNPDSTARKDLEQILRSTNRASELVKQIVAFSRKKERENNYFEPGLIIKETLKMLRSTLPATIEIKSNITIDGSTIFTNTNRFHQLFMNLCTNAYQAMEHDGGVLGVNLNTIQQIDHVPEEFLLEGERFIQIAVSDTGVGIAPQLRNRVFEPLFSTKGLNGRAGMGLCTAYHMVKMAGGAIWFEDRESGGTNFYVVFPVHTEERTDRHYAVKDTSEPTGSGNLLFVDDEPELVDMAKKIIESLGYQVECCFTGEEALQLFLQNPQRFDLIITDQIMPGMTGVEFATQVKQKVPRLPIILCTGYSSKISEENWSRYGIDAYVMKPFRRRDIAHLIKDLLEHKVTLERRTFEIQ